MEPPLPPTVPVSILLEKMTLCAFNHLYHDTEPDQPCINGGGVFV